MKLTSYRFHEIFGFVTITDVKLKFIYFDESKKSTSFFLFQEFSPSTATLHRMVESCPKQKIHLVLCFSINNGVFVQRKKVLHIWFLTSLSFLLIIEFSPVQAREKFGNYSYLQLTENNHQTKNFFKIFLHFQSIFTHFYNVSLSEIFEVVCLLSAIN